MMLKKSFLIICLYSLHVCTWLQSLRSDFYVNSFSLTLLQTHVWLKMEARLKRLAERLKAFGQNVARRFCVLLDVTDRTEQ